MSPTSRFGGVSALIVAILSLLYAIFFLLVTPRSTTLGTLGSASTFAISGFFSLAAYVALYRRVQHHHPDIALWALLLGASTSIATVLHGTYEALLFNRLAVTTGADSTMLALVQTLPTQINPMGLMSFGVVGIASYAWGWLLLRSNAFEQLLGYLGLLNALLLLTLFIAYVGGIQPLVLLAGGLTSVVVGPIWWTLLGIRLLKAPAVGAGSIQVLLPSTPLT